MAETTALVLIVVLAGGLAIPSKQPPKDASLAIGSYLPLEINNVSITVPSLRTRLEKQVSEELLEVEDQRSKVCNHSASSCECGNKNGPDITSGNGKNEKGENFWNEDETRVVESEGLRGERCLLTMRRSQGGLQDLLGKGLKGMTTEERLAEFRRRVELLRRRPSFENEKPKDPDSSSLDKDSAPIFVLPVSPFRGRKVSEEFQSDRKKNILKSIEKNVGTADKIKSEEPLRTRPSFKIDRTKDQCDRDPNSSSIDKDSTPIFALPVSPYNGMNFQKDLEKDEKKSLLKSIEENVGRWDGIKQVEPVQGSLSFEVDQTKECECTGESKSSSLNKDSASLFALPVTPFDGMNVKENIQNYKKKAVFKSIEDNVGKLDKIKPEEALRISPIEIEKTKEFDRNPKSFSADKDLSPTFTLSGSPFNGMNVQEDFQKDEKKSILKSIEENIKKVDEIKHSLKTMSSITDKTLREHLVQESAEKDTVNKKVSYKGESGDTMPSAFPVSGGDSKIQVLRPAWCQIFRPARVQQPVQVSPDSIKSSGYSGIKLPAQFLALTRLRERTLDIDEPLDVDSTTPSLKTSRMEQSSSNSNKFGPTLQGIIAVPQYINIK